MDLENRISNTGFFGKIIKKVAPYIAAIGLATMTMSCPNPFQSSNPSNTTSTPSGQPPGEPTMSIQVINLTASNPYRGSTQPSRTNSILIQDNYNDETSLTLQRATWGGPFNTLATLPTNTAQVYTDSGVAESTQYTYRVQANNSAGSSGWYTQTVTSAGPQVGAIDVNPPVADTYIDSGSTGSNFGSLDFVAISGSSIGGATNAASQALLSFQLPNLPSWATSFNSASLTLHDASGNGPYEIKYPPVDINGALVLNSWSENIVTYSTQPGTLLTDTNGYPLASVYTSPNSYGYTPSITMDVSKIVEYWYSNQWPNYGANYGINLYVNTTATPNGYYEFYSKEAQALDYPSLLAAHLQIEYNW